MLEKGKVYDIVMLTDHFGGEMAETTYAGRTVVEVKWPLVHLSDGMIVNVASHLFVKATESG